MIREVAHFGGVRYGDSESLFECLTADVKRPLRKGRAALLKRARYARESVVRVRANEPNRAHHQHQDHSQHHRIFGNVLSLIVTPQSA
jgi:hypothetical protein